MDSLLKRYFWVINLVLLASIAFLCARVVNNLLAEQIVGITTNKATQKKGPIDDLTNPNEALDWAEQIVGRNIFNSEPPEPVTEPDAGPPAEALRWRRYVTACHSRTRRTMRNE